MPARAGHGGSDYRVSGLPKPSSSCGNGTTGGDEHVLGVNQQVPHRGQGVKGEEV